MSRAGNADTIVVKATSNVYTVLTLVATIAVGLALFVVYQKHQALFGTGFF